MTSRITELEQSLAASEARVVELERERDEASRLADEVAGFYRTAVAKLVAAESAASTAMRDGMMEAARIAEYEADYAPMPSTAFGAHIAKAIRTRASSLPGGEGKAGWQPTHEHYKGGLYRVVARGLIEADLSPCVVYDNAAGETWVRPADDFDQTDPFVRFAALPRPPGDTEEAGR